MTQTASKTASKDQIEPENIPDELFLIDGSAYIFRAYHALPPLTRKDGTPIGAVLGFTNMMVKLLQDYQASAVAVIFDAKRENFRNEIYAEYKANRDDPPEDLIPQFALIREATEAFDLPYMELEGYEADDLIATYARLAKDLGKKVTIVSSDKDLMQLVDSDIRMLDPMKNKFLGTEDVIEKFGVPPEKVIDVQALAGDSIDNIPGVPGIGVKTAAQLIQEFGDLETLLERAGEIKQNKRRESLIEFAEQARISKKLVALDAHVDVPVSLEDMKARDPDSPKLLAFLQENGFKSVISRLGQTVEEEEQTTEGRENAASAFPPVKDNQYTLITDEKTLQDWIDEAYETGFLAIDTETTSLTPAKAKLAGISFTPSIGKAAYIPLGHVVEADLFGESKDDLKQMDLEKAMALLKPILEDESVLKIGHNIKYDWQMLSKHGVQMTPVEDTMLLSYVLDGTSHSNKMDELSKLFLDHTPIPYKDVAGSGTKQITFDKVSIDKALTYAAEDAEITLRLHKILRPRLAKEKMVHVYEDIERPLIPVIAGMEEDGILVDPAILKRMSNDFAQKLEALQTEIYQMSGHEFNIGSPKQIGEILFDNMGLQGGKKTKTGQWSTDVSTLETLAAQGHEIVGKILEWRQLSKLKSTYTDALQNEINPSTKRVHTSFSMAGTSTGRLASSDPNLQNIPIRTEEGRKIRTAFVAAPGHKILSADYSQVELRLAAALAGVEALKQAFKDKQDIHAITASQVFGVPLEEVDGELRRQAKAVNFGIIYGISGWGLAKQLGCDAADANEFIKRYLARFNEIQDYMETKKEEARKHGFVCTIFGRKCYIDGINDKNGARRAGAERQAINAPLQGTAADIMKRAMIKIPGALENAGLQSKMLLQVHDELIFEVPENEVEKTAALVKDIMENIVDIGVPLETETGIADSWAEAH